MLLLSMLAMVALAAVPAFAQQEQNAASQYGDITQEQEQCIQDALANSENLQDQSANSTQDGQYQNSEATQNQALDSEVTQNILQACGDITVNQVNQVVQAISAGGGGAAAAGEADAGDGAAAAGEAETLPDTGGASLFTVGAGALLVAGGLLARRLVR